MAGANRALAFTFTTDDKQAIAALKRMEKGFKGLDVQVDRTRKTGLNFGNSMAGLALGAGAVFATKEFEEAEAGAKKTEAVIRSTGNAAEVSAEQQAKLVDQLSRLAAVDDDVVNGGANMLRTFTAIKGENFGLALAASLDMAAFKGMDLASSAEAIGKALNDPVAGMGKLAKQGVLLSDVQKQQIRDFAAVGDVASAQGVILKELETEYGGQAEAAVTSSGKMKVALGEAAESAGKVLAPAVTLAADGVGLLGGAFESLPGPTQAAVLVLGAGGIAAKKLEERITDADGSLKNFDTSLSKVDKGLVLAGAGLASFSTTYSQLQRLTETGIDMEGFAVDLQNAAGGSIDLETALDRQGLSVSELADNINKLDRSTIDKLFSSDEGFLGSGYKKMGNELRQLDEQLADMASNGHTKEARQLYMELVSALEAQGVELEDITPWFSRYWEASDRAGESARASGGKIDEQTGAIVKNADAQRSWLGPIDANIRKWTDQAAAIDQVNTKLDENAAKAGDAFDAQSALTSSQFTLEDAQKAYQEALKSGDPDKVERAEQSLYEAIVRVSEAKVDLARKEAEARGNTLSAAEAADIQRGALQSLVKQTGTTSGSLQVLIDRLTLASAEHKIGVDSIEAEASLDRVIAKLDGIKARLGALGSAGGSGGAQIGSNASGGKATLGLGLGNLGNPRDGGMGNDAQPAGDAAPARQTNANLHMHVGTINVGGTVRDMDAAIYSAGRKLARQIKAA